MSEHYCKECKYGEGDVCMISGATHRTGIECPSWAQKEEVEMNFRVRETDDNVDAWTVADGEDCNSSNKYIHKDGTVGYCWIYDTEADAQAALNLYRKEHGPPEPTFVGHPEGALEIKVDPADPCGGSTAIRIFDTGATRDTAQDKLDYVKALSPIVLRRYVQYLDKHRLQPDGSYRDFDNWKRGVDQGVYHSSGGRHFMDVWLLTEGYATEDNHGPVEIEDALCARLFNDMGRLHEILKVKELRTLPSCTPPVEGEE